MEKRKIIIVECVSSSVNYIKDIYDEGYEPVLLEPYYKNIFLRNYMHSFHINELKRSLNKNVKYPKMISAKPSYNETLKMVEEINPIIIIPGSDKGVELATKLSYDLGLVGNNPKNLKKMRNKYECQEALRKSNIRSIRSRLVSNYEEALDFYNEMKKINKDVVVKPVSGISSLNVFVVKNENELKNAIKQNLGFTGKAHDNHTGKILIQEYIDGTEYTFNTVSCKGIHKVTSITKYGKYVVNGRKIYDYDQHIDESEENVEEIITYGLKVLDVIGLEYGAAHLEIMFDESGPVLIEANCRLIGGLNHVDVQEETLGLYEDKISLYSYLYPDKVLENKNLILYNSKNFLYTKFIPSINNSFVTKIKIDQSLKGLPGYRSYYSDKKFGFFKKTTDLSSNLAEVFFVYNDKETMIKNYEIIKNIEENHPHKLLSGIF